MVIYKCCKFSTRLPGSGTSLTNSRGSRVAGRGSRVQSRGRGSNVAVAGPLSRSRVHCRGRGSNVAVGENDLGFEVTAE